MGSKTLFHEVSPSKCAPHPRLTVDDNEFLTTTQGLVGEVVQQVHGGELHDLPQVCKEVQTEGERVGDDKGKFCTIIVYH